jgi:hypothetical protein
MSSSDSIRIEDRGIEAEHTLFGETNREELLAGSTFGERECLFTLCPYIVINDHSPRFYSLSGERDCLFNLRDMNLLIVTLDFSDVYTVRKDVFNTVCRHYLEEVRWLVEFYHARHHLTLIRAILTLIPAFNAV